MSMVQVMPRHLARSVVGKWRGPEYVLSFLSFGYGSNLLVSHFGSGICVVSQSGYPQYNLKLGIVVRSWLLSTLILISNAMDHRLSTLTHLWRWFSSCDVSVISSANTERKKLCRWGGKVDGESSGTCGRFRIAISSASMKRIGASGSPCCTPAVGVKKDDVTPSGVVM